MSTLKTKLYIHNIYIFFLSLQNILQCPTIFSSEKIISFTIVMSKIYLIHGI